MRASRTAGAGMDALGLRGARPHDAGLANSVADDLTAEDAGATALVHEDGATLDVAFDVIVGDVVSERAVVGRAEDEQALAECARLAPVQVVAVEGQVHIGVVDQRHVEVVAAIRGERVVRHVGHDGGRCVCFEQEPISRERGVAVVDRVVEEVQVGRPRRVVVVDVRQEAAGDLVVHEVDGAGHVGEVDRALQRGAIRFVPLKPVILLSVILKFVTPMPRMPWLSKSFNCIHASWTFAVAFM